MPWFILTPRETELVMRTAGSASNGRVIKLLQEKLDPLTGEITLTDAELEDVRTTALRWKGGHEKALRAVVSAADRHNI